MLSTQLFPFSEYWWVYLAFSAFVLVLLTVDLGVFHRRPHSISLKEAGIWTVVFATLAMLFAAGLRSYASKLVGPDYANRVTLEFLTGYVIELALSVDNLFVFVLIFGYFGIERHRQHRILFYGILARHPCSAASSSRWARPCCRFSGC